VFCPQCQAEYIPGFTRCADCSIDLVEVLPADKPRSRTVPDLTTVLSSRDPGLVAVAKSLLQSADIRFSVCGELLQNPYAFGPVELQVLASDADDARRILADLSQPETPP
jgi:hypothetical protein